MGARAIWKGVVRFGDVSVPVKLYSAVEDRSVHFRLLHEKGLVPVKQEMVHPGTGKPVAREDVKRGWVADDGSVVVLAPEEIEEVAPEASRDIEITRFLDPAAVSHPWYVRPYYLGPDGDDEGYFALTRALQRSGKVGVARWVMRKKTYHGALRVEGEHLMLVTLRSAEEVVPAATLPAPAGRKLAKAEVDMAGKLLEALHGDFDPNEWRDEYRDRVLELVEAKAEGKTVAIEPYREKTEAADLADALKASLDAARKSA